MSNFEKNANEYNDSTYIDINGLEYSYYYENSKQKISEFTTNTILRNDEISDSFILNDRMSSFYSI